MATSKNSRKVVSEALFNTDAQLQLLERLGDGAEVELDARNPYAMRVTVGGKKFRVIVKEVEQG